MISSEKMNLKSVKSFKCLDYRCHSYRTWYQKKLVQIFHWCKFLLDKKRLNSRVDCIQEFTLLESVSTLTSKAKTKIMPCFVCFYVAVGASEFFPYKCCPINKSGRHVIARDDKQHNNTASRRCVYRCDVKWPPRTNASASWSLHILCVCEISPFQQNTMNSEVFQAVKITSIP